MAEAPQSSAEERDLLTCKLCKEIFTTPKILPCLHTFCSGCTEQHITRSTLEIQDEPRFSITCPLCRITTDVSSGHADSLKTNLFLTNLLEIFQAKHSPPSNCAICLLAKGVDEQAHLRCIECGDFLCRSCGNSHNFSKLTLHHTIVSIHDLTSGAFDQHMRDAQHVFCEKHEEIVQYFCRTCNHSTCRDCIILEHKNHDYITDEKAVCEIKPQLERTITHLDKKLASYQKRENELVNKMQHVSSNKDAAITAVNKYITELTKRIKSHGDAVIEKLSRTFSSVEKDLSSKCEEAVRKREHILETKHVYNSLLERGERAELLSLHSELKGSVELLNKMDTCSNDSMPILKFPVITKNKFVNSKTLTFLYIDSTEYTCWGKVANTPMVLWPKDGTVDLRDQMKNTQGIKEHAQANKNKTTDKHIITPEVIPEDLPINIKDQTKTIEEHKQNVNTDTSDTSVEVVLSLDTKTNDDITIHSTKPMDKMTKVQSKSQLGTHEISSSIDISDKLECRSFSANLDGETNPNITAMVITTDQTIILADTANNCLKILTLDGLWLRTNSVCLCRTPFRIAVYSGKLAVTDHRSLCVVSTGIQSQRIFEHIFPEKRDRFPVVFDKTQPGIIAVGNSDCNNRVPVTFFDQEGKPVSRISTKVDVLPIYMAQNSEGNFIISDWAGSCVRILTHLGHIQCEYSPEFTKEEKAQNKKQTGRAHYWRPGDIAVGQDDKIYVCDGFRGRIIILEQNAKCVSELYLNKFPVAVCVSEYNTIFVSSYNNHITMFRFKYNLQKKNNPSKALKTNVNIH